MQCSPGAVLIVISFLKKTSLINLNKKKTELLIYALDR